MRLSVAYVYLFNLPLIYAHSPRPDLRFIGSTLAFICMQMSWKSNYRRNKGPNLLSLLSRGKTEKLLMPYVLSRPPPISLLCKAITLCARTHRTTICNAPIRIYIKLRKKRRLPPNGAGRRTPRTSPRLLLRH